MGNRWRPQNTPDDLRIINDVLSGDVESFALLIARYKQDVFLAIRGHVPAGAIDELAHETFIRAFEKLSAYKRKRPFKNWLIAIAVNQCMDFWRRAARNREAPISALGDEGSDWMETLGHATGKNDIENDLALQQLRSAVHAALDTLPADDRIIIGLIYKDELKHGEIAHILGWSIARVKVRAHRARRKLKLLLQERFPSGGER